MPFLWSMWAGSVLIHVSSFRRTNNRKNIVCKNVWSDEVPWFINFQIFSGCCTVSSSVVMQKPNFLGPFSYSLRCFLLPRLWDSIEIYEYHQWLYHYFVVKCSTQNPFCHLRYTTLNLKHDCSSLLSMLRSKATIHKEKYSQFFSWICQRRATSCHLHFIIFKKFPCLRLKQVISTEEWPLQVSWLQCRRDQTALHSIMQQIPIIQEIDFESLQIFQFAPLICFEILSNEEHFLYTLGFQESGLPATMKYHL